MLYKVSLLCCIILVVVAGVLKPGNIKNCRAIGGKCVTAKDCTKQDVLKTSCPRGRLCCATGKQKRGNAVKKRNSKGCKQKHSCKKSGGRCIPGNQRCLGKVKNGACKNNICQCCILKDGDRTETKLRGVKKKKKPQRGNKDGNKKKKPRKGNKGDKKQTKKGTDNDKGCKKKKKCKGFCVGKDEECLGELNSKGCKGKHCSCCTIGEENGQKVKKNKKNKKDKKDKKASSDTNGGNSEYDYMGSYEGDYSGDYYYYNEDQCFGQNVNGSCSKEGCFICGDGECFPADWKCDHIDDCVDGSDELGCPPQPKYAPGSCPREYKWVLNSCYKVVTQPSSWLDARMTCKSLNGDLGLVYDHKLFTAYMSAFHKIDQVVYWVGIHRENGTYTWVNGTVLPNNSSLWGSTENPVQGNDGEDCLVLNFTEKRLQPTSCEVDTVNNKSIHSICEYVDNDYYGHYDYDY